MSSRLLDVLKDAAARATPQVKRPAMIGTAVLVCLAALVVAGLANTENPLAMPSQLGGMAVSQAVWGLRPSNLLMVLPIGSFLVVLARSFIGMRAFGLFTPMLIALAFLQIGPIYGPIVMMAAVTAGMIVAPSLLKLRMTRVGFLGVLISLVVFVLAALQLALDTALQVDAMPVVVTALIVERWWRQWEKDGYFEAARVAANTMVLALAIQFMMVSQIALTLIEVSPLLLPGICAVAITILGRYRGLRLTEIPRFLPIWFDGFSRRLAARQGGNELADEVLAARTQAEAEAEGAPGTIADPADSDKAATPPDTALPAPAPAIAAASVPPSPPIAEPAAGPIVDPPLVPEQANPANDCNTAPPPPVDWDAVRAELGLPFLGAAYAQPAEPAAPPQLGSLSALFVRRGVPDRLLKPGLLGLLHAGRRDLGHQHAQRADREVQSAQRHREGTRQGGGEGGAERARDRDHGHDLRYLRIWGTDALRSA